MPKALVVRGSGQPLVDLGPHDRADFVVGEAPASASAAPSPAAAPAKCGLVVAAAALSLTGIASAFAIAASAVRRAEAAACRAPALPRQARRAIAPDVVGDATDRSAGSRIRAYADAVIAALVRVAG